MEKDKKPFNKTYLFAPTLLTIIILLVSIYMIVTSGPKPVPFCGQSDTCDETSINNTIANTLITITIPWSVITWFVFGVLRSIRKNKK